LRIMLLGASGFLGRALQKALSADPSVEVVLVTRSPKSLAHLGATVIHADDVLANLEGMDWVVNCAVDYGRAGSLGAFAANVEWPIAIMRRASEVGTSFINIGTFYEKFPLATYTPLRTYSLTKSLVDAVGPEIYFGSESGKFFSLRLEHLYGPGDAQEKFVPWLLNQMLSRVSEIKLTSCLQKRDFIFVDDAARMILAFIRSFQSVDTGRSLEIGTSVSVPVQDLVYAASRIARYEGELRFGSLDSPPGEIADSSADPYLRELLGMRFESLEVGLSRTWSSYTD
jgi:nucleoside-diphosphate-sugar epimerase